MQQEFVPVRAADRADLLRDLTHIHEILNGWGERLAVTPGGDARFLLARIDVAGQAAAYAAACVRTVYPKAASDA